MMTLETLQTDLQQAQQEAKRLGMNRSTQARFEDASAATGWLLVELEKRRKNGL